MSVPPSILQIPYNLTAGMSQDGLRRAIQGNFDAIQKTMQGLQGYVNTSVAPVINLASSQFSSSSEILGSQVAGFARPSVAYTEEGVQVQTHIPRYEVVDTDDFYDALMMEEGTTNLLTANQSSVETDTTGFTAESATISRDTTQAYSGAASLKVITSNVQNEEGVRITYVAATPATAYSAQVRVWGTGTVYVFLSAYNSGHTFLGNASALVALSGTKQLIEISNFVTPANTAQLELAVLTEAKQNITFWYDSGGIEQLPYCTTWQIGDTARSPESMVIPTAGIFTPGSWTVELRYKPIDNSNATNRVLWQCLIDTNNYWLINVTGNGTLILVLYSGGTAYQIASASGLIAVNTQYSIMASGSVVGSATALTLCCNGVQIGSIPYVEPVGTMPALMYVGSDWEPLWQCDGLIDDLRFSNIARTITDHKNYISSNQPHPVDANTTLLMEFDQTLRQTAVNRLTNVQGTFTIADALTTSDPSKATHIVPTGWTTAEATIMQAMSELPATGGNITLLDGTFWVDAPATIPGGFITLIGQGNSTVLIAKAYLGFSAAGYGAVIQDNYFATVQQTAVTIINMVINGNGYGSGINLSSTSGCTISTVTCKNCTYGGSSQGIILQVANNASIQSSNNIITSATCQNNTVGIYINTPNNILTNSQILNNATFGIETSYSSYNQITNNQINNNGYHGIHCHTGSHNTITGNNCQANSQASNNVYNNIQIDNSSYNSIQNNTCRKGAGPVYPYAGVQITTGSTSNLVSSNDCYTGGATAGLSDAGTTTNFGSGNRVNSGAWSTTPS